MLKHIEKKMRLHLHPEVYVINRKPLILIAYWTDFYKNLAFYTEYLKKYENAYVFFQLGWSIELDDFQQKVIAGFKEIYATNPNISYNFLCNTEKEVEILAAHDIPACFVNQNAFLDFNRYRVIPEIEKVYDALYVARITPFKRHYLAKNIQNLRIVGRYSEKESDFAKETLEMLSHCSYKEFVSGSVMSEEMNKSRVGLCLSSGEGSMFVACEYLLCGLPIVNTKNVGGRDFMFEPSYALTVEDTPEAVAQGVEVMKSCEVSADEIRRRTIEKMMLHRNKFISIVQEILDKNGIACNFSEQWEKVYVNKMNIRVRTDFGKIHRVFPGIFK